MTAEIGRSQYGRLVELSNADRDAVRQPSSGKARLMLDPELERVHGGMETFVRVSVVRFATGIMEIQYPVTSSQVIYQDIEINMRCTVFLNMPPAGSMMSIFS